MGLVSLYSSAIMSMKATCYHSLQMKGYSKTGIGY
jgi:hypothetical protein